jgi:hypothetical protein
MNRNFTHFTLQEIVCTRHRWIDVASAEVPNYVGHCQEREAQREHHS